MLARRSSMSPTGSLAFTLPHHMGPTFTFIRSSVQICAPLPAGKTLAFLLPLCMRVRALRQAAEEAADEGEGEEGEEREAELEAEAEGLKAVVVRCG